MRQAGRSGTTIKNQIMTKSREAASVGSLFQLPACGAAIVGPLVTRWLAPFLASAALSCPHGHVGTDKGVPAFGALKAAHLTGELAATSRLV
jgi:hypothetical protein